MNTYIGLDISLKSTSICIVDDNGAVISEKVLAPDPDLIAEYVHSQEGDVQRVGLESGPMSIWLWRELASRDVPVICIDARHAKSSLAMQINKSDRNNAFGIARIMQTGWYREVQIKSTQSDTSRTLLHSRALLLKMKHDLENQIRLTISNRLIRTGPT